MKSQDRASTHLPDHSSNVARIVWIVYALILIALQIASQIAAFREIQTINLTHAQLQGLQAMGLSGEFYVVWRFFWQIPNPLLWGGLGLLLFWRKANDRSVLIISAMMVGIGMSASIPPWKSFAAAYPEWVWLVPLVALIGNMCIYSFFFVFPTGHYVPKWTWSVAITLSVFNILNSYDFALPASLVIAGKSMDWVFPAFLLVSLASAIGAPLYRYQRVSTPVEREQIKWVVFPVIVAFILFAATASTVFLAPGGNPDTDMSFITVFVQPIGWVGALSVIPLSIGISVLRFRLFDIDLIIRRTLIYSTLTALLALVYFGSVILLQQLFHALTGAGGDVAIIISTLAIYVLFNPFRRRIQDFLDRRFYRRKYDAQKVLAQFAQTARDETNLEKLTDELIRVVDETMQPESVSVWMKKTDGETRGK